MPKIARVAGIVALVLAGLDVLSAAMGQIVQLAAAVIPLVAGIGILRKRAWSAYGFALFELAGVFLILLLAVHEGSSAVRSPAVAAGIALSAILIPLFLFAGRSLGSLRLERGRAWPWIAMSVALVVPFIFFQAFVIPTSTMENTLLIGDHILVRSFPRPNLGRGDMIAFIYPSDRVQSFVKRVIGVPGDRIKIVGKVVYRNGAVLKEPYAVHKTGYVEPYRDNFPSEPTLPLERGGVEMLQNHVVGGEVVVPDGKYFVLGDNRDASWDSRYWGFVGFGDLIGKPVLIYDSEDQPTGGSHRVRWRRLFKLL